MVTKNFVGFTGDNMADTTVGPMGFPLPEPDTRPKIDWQCPKCQYVHSAPEPAIAGQQHICSCIGTTVKRVPNEVATIWTFDPTDPVMAAHMAVNSCTVMVKV
jgi:hypothetical protein